MEECSNESCNGCANEIPYSLFVMTENGPRQQVCRFGLEWTSREERREISQVEGKNW